MRRKKSCICCETDITTKFKDYRKVCTHEVVIKLTRLESDRELLYWIANNLKVDFLDCNPKTIGRKRKPLSTQHKMNTKNKKSRCRNNEINKIMKQTVKNNLTSKRLIVVQPGSKRNSFSITCTRSKNSGKQTIDVISEQLTGSKTNKRKQNIGRLSTKTTRNTKTQPSNEVISDADAQTMIVSSFSFDFFEDANNPTTLKNNNRLNFEADSSKSKDDFVNTLNPNNVVNDDEKVNEGNVGIQTSSTLQPSSSSNLAEENVAVQNTSMKCTKNKQNETEKLTCHNVSQQDYILPVSVMNENKPDCSNVRTIYDLMNKVSLLMPSWNLHILPDTNTFCISEVTRNRSGIPHLSKSIEIDDDFKAKVYIYQQHCKKFDGIYDSEDTVENLIDIVHHYG